MVIPDVAADPASCGSAGIDQRRFVASMLSVPLTWHDQVVGVLNVQTETHRDFTRVRRRQLSAIADLLAGIVEKGRLQREAEAQVEQLEALDQARNELIALVTHELRTPLAVVRAYTDLLAEEPPLDGRSSRDVKRRQTRAAWHPARSTRSSGWTGSSTRSSTPCAWSRTSRRTLQTDRPRRDGRRPARRTLAPLLAQPPHHGSCGSRRLHVMADPARLRQVLEHLLENAVKYAPPDTRVELDWRLVEGVVRIEVTDDGPGIPPEWRDRIFEPYARRETPTARGSGIGLYAARRLAESMRAGCGASPAPSGGARFVLALPAAVAV